MRPMPSPSSNTISSLSSTTSQRRLGHDLLTRLRCQEPQPGTLGTQQPLEPRFIQQHLLVCGVPEGLDLLFLAPGCKGPLPDSEGQQRLEVRGLGIAVASFPLADGSARDTQQLSQARLGQPDGGAQGQHSLAKGIVCFTLDGSLHA